MKDLDIKILRSFVSVAETGNMTVSARRLVQTQGAVSQQIKRLEAALDHKLFLRSGQGLKLTAAGTKLLAQAQQLIAANDAIVRSFRPGDRRRTLRFGLPYDLVSAYLTATLERFSPAFPEVEVDLFCEASPTLRERVASGALDLAVVEEAVGTEGGEVLRVEPLVWVGPGGGAAHRRRPLPLSLVAENCAFRQPVHDALDRAGIAWRTVFQNGDLNATMATVRGGLSVTACLAGLVPPGLGVLPPDCGLPALPGVAIKLYRADRTPAPLTEEFCAMLRQAISAGG